VLSDKAQPHRVTSARISILPTERDWIARVDHSGSRFVSSITSRAAKRPFDAQRGIASPGLPHHSVGERRGGQLVELRVCSRVRVRNKHGAKPAGIHILAGLGCTISSPTMVTLRSAIPPKVGRPLIIDYVPTKQTIRLFIRAHMGGS